MLFKDLGEFNAQSDLFTDPARSETDNLGPHLIVVDDFYEDPYEVRKIALGLEYYQYSPWLESPDKAQLPQHSMDRPPWLSSALMVRSGKPVEDPKPGFRYAGTEVRTKLASIIKEKISTDTWHILGDGWNGAFHLQYAGDTDPMRAVHHHFKPGDVYPRGWSGVVYLHPDPPPRSGTCIWRNRETGKCIGFEGMWTSKEYHRYEVVLEVENRFNRLVLFRENVLHRPNVPFGNSPETGRMTQTFFFLSERRQ